MANDDRYGDRDYSNARSRDWDHDRERGSSERGGGDERGFFGRAGEEVRSWFGGDDDGASRGQDQDRGYGRDRDDRGDYRRTEQYADQGRSSGRYYQNERAQGQQGRGDDRDFSERGHGGSSTSFSGSGGVNQGMGSYGGSGGGSDGGYGVGTGGNAGPGYAPEFSGGPRFDRQDVGSTGTHGAHPVASPYGEAQTGYTGGGGGGSGSSARSQAILDQYARTHGGQAYGQGNQQPRGQQGYAQQSYGYAQGHGQQSDQSGFRQGASSTHDPHYSEWRRRQIEAIDRDYDEYRQENASRFETEFGSFREKRGQQRQYMGTVTEHMEVVGSDDQHVGTVDKVKDGRIILTKSDPNAGGHHHSIPCGWLERVEDKVVLNKTAEEAMKAWRDEETSRALNENKDSGSDGPHILDRSFSGTYKDEDR